LCWTAVIRSFQFAFVITAESIARQLGSGVAGEWLPLQFSKLTASGKRYSANVAGQDAGREMEVRALLRSVSSCVRNDNFKFRVKVGGPSFHVPTKEADRSLFSKGAKARSVATVIKSDELAIEF